MKPQLERFEVEAVGDRDDQLTVDHEALLVHAREHFARLGQ